MGRCPAAQRFQALDLCKILLVASETCSFLGTRNHRHIFLYAVCRLLVEGGPGSMGNIEKGNFASAYESNQGHEATKNIS